MGQTDEGFALDLGGADWSVIDIDAEGWRERPMGSPRFRRSPGMRPCPALLAREQTWNVCGPS